MSEPGNFKFIVPWIRAQLSVVVLATATMAHGLGFLVAAMGGN